MAPKLEDLGAIETLESAAVVSGTLVDKGHQYVESGSTAIATKVVSGDQLVIGVGGGHGALAVSTTIGAHGDLSVAIGGTALDTTLFGEADIQSGGTAIGMTVKSGGLLLVDDGGTASGVVSSGGTLALFGSNPSAAGVTLLTGATLELGGGGHVGSGDVSRGFPESSWSTAARRPAGRSCPVGAWTSFSSLASSAARRSAAAARSLSRTPAKRST